MEILAQIGGAAFALTNSVIGLRLMLLWLRTRELPELLIGTGLFLMAGFGYPLASAARQIPELPDAWRETLGLVGGGLVAVGLAANLAFTWLIFRRHEAWAKALVLVVSGAALAVFSIQWWAYGWSTGGEIYWPALPAILTVGMAWPFLECWQYAGMLRKRMALGLADPVVADRFLLYALANGFGIVTNIVGWIFILKQIEMLADPVGAPILAVLGTVSAILMWLAFLPPQAYLRHVRARATSAA